MPDVLAIERLSAGYGEAIVLAEVSLTVPEGNTGDTPSATVDVTLSAPSGRNVSVDYETIDVSATVADTDYTQASGTLDFAPGETSASVQVQVVGDEDVTAGRDDRGPDRPAGATADGGSRGGDVDDLEPLEGER